MGLMGLMGPTCLTPVFRAKLAFPLMHGLTCVEVWYYWPVFEACAREAKVMSIMCSYNAVNGVAIGSAAWAHGAHALCLGRAPGARQMPREAPGARRRTREASGDIPGMIVISSA